MKSYIIYLPQFETSVKWATHAKTTGLEQGWDIELFEGVDGRTVADAAWDTVGISINQSNAKCKDLLKLPGVRGCFLSHYNLWKQCIQVNSPIGIFEHDIEFLGPIPDINGVEDLLKLEGFELRKPRPAGTWYEGARAYILTPAGATKLVQWVDQHGCLPADINIGNNVVKIDLDLTNCVRQVPMHNSKHDKHTISFTWNLEKQV